MISGRSTAGVRKPECATGSVTEVVGDISLLVAVGYNGGAVVFSLLESNEHLDTDLARHDAKMALWPTRFPSEPGLYLFTGQTTLEICEEDAGSLHQEVFHRCVFSSLKEGLSPQTGPRRGLSS